MTAPKKNNKRSSTLSLAVVAAVWIALLWGSSAEAARTYNKNLGTNAFGRYLKSEKSVKSCKSAKSGDSDYDQ